MGQMSLRLLCYPNQWYYLFFINVDILDVLLVDSLWYLQLRT